MNKQNYKKFFKILISNLLFLLITFNQNAISKAIPPGSGEGDVPANILILLDSSASMKRKIITGDGIENPSDIVELSDGNVIIAEGNLGFAKINTTDKTVDNSFSNDNRKFRGLWNDSCTVNGTGTTSASTGTPGVSEYWSGKWTLYLVPTLPIGRPLLLNVPSNGTYPIAMFLPCSGWYQGEVI